MTLIRKRHWINDVNDDFAEVLDYWNKLPWAVSSWTIGNVYDPERFDLVPKKGYYDEQIKKVEQDIETLERNQQSAISYYENQKRILQEKKEKLERERDNKRDG